MTRLIEDIYNDIQNLTASEFLSTQSISTHAGNSQIINNQLLIAMFDQVVLLLQSYRTNSNLKPYSATENWMVESDWWSLTVDQTAELLELKKDGWGEIYSAEDSSTKWHVGLNGFIQRPWMGRSISSGSDRATPHFFNNGIVRFFLLYDKVNDYIEISDLDEFGDDFFDPQYVGIETPTALNKWLDGLDSIVSKLKSSTHVKNGTWQPVRTDMTLNFVTGDKYHSNISYDLAFWSDDLTGDSGELISMRAVGQNNSSGGVSIDETVYSDGITINIDDGEGGYTQFTFPTELNGVSFGMTVDELFTLIKSVNTDEKDGGISLSHRKVITFSDPADDGSSYEGGLLVRSSTFNFENEEGELVKKWNFDQNILSSYTLSSYSLEGDGVGGDELWEGNTQKTADYSKTPSVVIQVDTFIEGDIVGTIALPTQETVTDAVTLTTQLNSYRIATGIDLSLYTVKTLSPPEA